MIWESPEVWEIIGTMNIAGTIMIFSAPITFLLFVCFGETSRTIRRQAEPISKESRGSLVLTWNLFKMGGLFTLFWYALYDLCLLMMTLHPNVSAITLQ